MRAALLLVLSAAAAPATARVTDFAPGGFVSAHEGVSQASPAQLWALLVQPARWWNKAHSFSGDAANLSLDARPGGCFCESLPAAGGGVVHATVIHVDPQKILRLSGALGPLQDQAVNGTLSISLAPVPGGGTRVRFTYVVGGYAAFPIKDIAGAVDGVIGEQHGRFLAAAES